MTAGKRDSLIAFQSASVTTDDYGAEIPTWAETAQAWADVRYGRGDERRQAAMEGGAQPATFIVLANLDTLDVIIRDRISFDGSAWDILGIAKPDRATVEFSAVRAE